MIVKCSKQNLSMLNDKNINLAHIYFSETNYDSRLMKEICSAKDACPNINISFICKLGNTQKNDKQYEIFRLKYKNGGLLDLKFLNFFAWSIRAFMQLNKLQVNIIHAHGLPALIVSAVFKKIFKCGLIFDARELESKRNHRGLFMNSLLSFIEKYLINLCDSILVVSPSIKKFYETQFPKKNFYLLVNACSKREKQASLINIRDKFKIPNSSLIFMYIGALGRVRGIDLYLNVFKKLSEKHHLVLMGDGLLKEQIIDVSKTTKNIHYLPPVSWENVVGIAEDADYILRVAEVSSLSYKLALPNTFFQAMLARTPLIINEECIEMLNFYQEDEMLISTKYSESSLYQLIKNLKKRDYRNTKPLPSYLTWEFYESVLFYVYSNSLECKAAA